MGMIEAPTECFITGLPTMNIKSQYHTIEYYIEIEGKRIYLQFEHSFNPSVDILKNQDIFIKLIKKGKVNSAVILNNSILIDLLVEEKNNG